MRRHERSDGRLLQSNGMSDRGRGYPQFLTAVIVLTLWPMASSGRNESRPLNENQTEVTADVSFSGLEWTFVRIRYSTPADQLAEFRRIYGVEPWAVDGPVAEENLSRRMGRVTSVTVHDPIVLDLSDERIWNYPWIYIVEPANLNFTTTRHLIH